MLRLTITNPDICLVDCGNYPFLFDLAASWPDHLGRMSYIFRTTEGGRNTRSAQVKQFDSGGFCRGINAQGRVSADSLVSRYRLEKHTAKAAVEELNSLRPDLVIGANNSLQVQTQVARWCAANRKPFVYWLQDLRGEAALSILRKRVPLVGYLVGKRDIATEKGLLKQSAHVISITEAFHPYLLSASVGPERISVIPNWAPIERIPRRPKSNSWSRSMQLSEKRVLLYTGNLGMKHNPALLLELCEALKARPDVVVALVAEGTGVSWLAERAKQRNLTNLLIQGFVGADTLPDVLGAADVFIALLEPDASNFSVPSKVWTYLCGGKPIILAVPRNNQAAAVVNTIGAGVSCEPSAVSEFISHCARLLDCTPGHRASLGEKGRAFAELNFRTSQITARVGRCIDLGFEAFLEDSLGLQLEPSAVPYEPQLDGVQAVRYRAQGQ